jgi:hypothetical protein
MGFKEMLPPGGELNISSSSKYWILSCVEPMDVEDTPGVVLKCTEFVTVATKSSRRFMDRMVEVGSLSDFLGIVTVVSFS